MADPAPAVDGAMTASYAARILRAWEAHEHGPGGDALRALLADYDRRGTANAGYLALLERYDGQAYEDLAAECERAQAEAVRLRAELARYGALPLAGAFLVEGIPVQLIFSGPDGPVTLRAAADAQTRTDT